MATRLKVDLKAVPPAAQYAIAAGVPLLIIILFFFIYYKPKAAEIKLLEKNIAKQEQEIGKAEAKLRKLPQIKARYEVLVQELDELKRQLPEEKEVTTLLKQVSDLGINAGLEIKLWKPSQRKIHSSGVVYEIPVKVEMVGSYHRLGYFFSSLTRLSRIVNVTNIKLGNAKPETREAKLQISFVALTFSAIPEGEMQKGVAGRKGRRGRR
ncbi:MAG: type 4a pilus biogenesis protein PilO [Nitrospirae bacterium]|nr:type 4a pilus biogenesis protein PilO [Nitrospirota bacterium]